MTTHELFIRLARMKLVILYLCTDYDHIIIPLDNCTSIEDIKLFCDTNARQASWKYYELSGNYLDDNYIPCGDYARFYKNAFRTPLGEFTKTLQILEYTTIERLFESLHEL